MIKIIKRTVSLHILFFLFCCVVGSCGIYKHNDQKKEDEKIIRVQILNEARAHSGTKYRSGGKTPAGFDCSGFTGYVFRQHGITLNASSRTQAKQGKKVDIGKARPGDLVFFGTAFKINHVGIVSQNKNGKLSVIHSTNSQGIVEDDISQIIYWKKRLKFARDVISP